MSKLGCVLSCSAGVAALLVAAALAGPAVAQSADLAKSELVGKIEGPQLVLDPAQVPKECHEAPMLAELVKAGKLPPVKDRLPAEPLVVKPLKEIGKYGGTWRRGFTGTGDVERRHVGERQAGPPRQDRRDDGAVPVRRPLFPVLRHAGRRHADRRRPIGAPV